uniref:Uncharacterized protein n=1 Tax=Anguilla anguilla TaxID=7936 RepID=A0A0E9SD43_ANGAN
MLIYRFHCTTVLIFQAFDSSGFVLQQFCF